MHYMKDLKLRCKYSHCEYLGLINFFCSDLFYVDGYYRIFDSSSEDLQDYKFKYMLKLEGTLPNAAESGTVTILTDDKDLLQSCSLDESATESIHL